MFSLLWLSLLLLLLLTLTSTYDHVCCDWLTTLTNSVQIMHCIQQISLWDTQACGFTWRVLNIMSFIKYHNLIGQCYVHLSHVTAALLYFSFYFWSFSFFPIYTKSTLIDRTHDQQEGAWPLDHCDIQDSWIITDYIQIITKMNQLCWWNVFKDACRMGRWSFWSWFDVNWSSCVEDDFYIFILWPLTVPSQICYYTVFQKKHVTTFSTITLTISVRLQ